VRRSLSNKISIIKLFLNFFTLENIVLVTYFNGEIYKVQLSVKLAPPCKEKKSKRMSVIEAAGSLTYGVVNKVYCMGIYLTIEGVNLQ
jgi:hypothetical protein